MKIISGGQTGADRAGLDAAAALGVPTGGTAPASYWTERGPDPGLETLGLVARGSAEFRTERNVLDADATVIFAARRDSPGSELTKAMARRHGRAFVVIDPWESGAHAALVDFVRSHAPSVLNVAGHRESQAPGTYQRVLAVVTAALRDLGAADPP